MSAFNVGETGLARQIENRPARVTVDGVRQFAWRIHDAVTLTRVGKPHQQQFECLRCQVLFLTSMDKWLQAGIHLRLPDRQSP